MSKIVKSYEIPSLGRVNIIHVTEKESQFINGEYYANVAGYGNAGRYGHSIKKTENRMLEEVKYYLEKEKEKLDEKNALISKGLEFIAKKIKNIHTPQLNDGEVN